MKFTCPNKKSKEWIGLVKDLGDELKAYKAFIKNDYNIPIIEKDVTDIFGEGIVKALEDITKRIKILQSDKTPQTAPEVQGLKKIHDRLLNSLLNETHKEGMVFLSKQISDEIDEIDEVLEMSDKKTIRARSNRTRRAISFIDSTLPIIDDITSFLIDKKMDAQEQEIYDLLSSKRAVLKNKRDKLIDNGRDIFEALLLPYLGDRNNPKLLAEINKNLPPDKQVKEFDLLTALREGDKDINFLDRWLRSMGNSRNDILKLVNEAVLTRKQASRMGALEDKYDLMDIREEYFKTGAKNFDFIYERDKSGNLTGNFVSDRRWSEWRKDRTAHRRQLLKNYGVNFVEDLDEDQKKQFIKDRVQWEEQNTEKISIVRPGETKTKRISAPAMAKYANKDYASLNQHQLKALNAITKMKEQLDMKLKPSSRNPYRVPQVTKDFFERVKNIKNPGQMRELIQENFHNRKYDIDRGNISNVEDATASYVLSDNGREQEVLPIHFANKLDNMERDLSLDIISSMVLYSHMARDYEEMNKIVDALELGREVMREQKVVETDFQGKVKKTVSFIGGTKVENKLFKENSLAFEKFEGYMSMVVYGKTRLSGKTIKIGGETVDRAGAIEKIKAHKKDTIKINGQKWTTAEALKQLNNIADDKGEFKIGGMQFDREKSIDTLGRYTAVNSLALNMYSGISNVLYGETMLRNEAVAGRYFSQKDLAKGTVDYWSGVPGYLAQHGNTHNTSKLGLWSEKFDTLQDYQSNKHEVDSMRRTWFSKSMKLSSLFFLNHAGEHFMQNRTSLALAQSTKVKDSKGQEIALYDAYEVKDGRLRLMEGVTKLDGSEWTKEDEVMFTRRQDFINQRMHGIYNQNDAAAVQLYAVGRLGMMFRKFIVPGFDRRWESANYNFMLGDFTEGYYISTGIFLQNVMKDMAQMKFTLMKNWNELSDLRKANIKKTMTEVTVMLSVGVILAMLGGADDDSWLLSMGEYQARRLITELWFYSNPSEALKILRSPTAAVTPIQNAITFMGSMFQPTRKLQTGRYEDWYKWQRDMLRLLPVYRTLDRAFHPEEAVRYWNSQ